MLKKAKNRMTSLTKQWAGRIRETWERGRSLRFHTVTEYKVQVPFGMIFKNKPHHHLTFEKGERMQIDGITVTARGITGEVPHIQAAVRDHWVTLAGAHHPPKPIMPSAQGTGVPVTPTETSSVPGKIPMEDVPPEVLAKVTAGEPLTMEEMSWIWGRAVPVYGVFGLSIPTETYHHKGAQFVTDPKTPPRDNDEDWGFPPLLPPATTEAVLRD